uniref:Uncharacterized protein n=1 Tax=Aegilops tauschii TaxID=37682 RepID=M8BYL6_AEGTA
MPPSALCFAPTLRAAKFGSCEFPELTAPSPKFPRLKQLTLCRVSISEDSLHGMLSGCIALESLSLDRNIGIGRLCISSPTVRRFSFSPHRDKQGIVTCQELLVQDVPCLERLILHDSHIGPATIRITGAPKLELLGLLSHGISTLKPGTTVLQKTIDVSLTTIMHKVKILVVDSIGPNLDAIVGLLKCFTFLERLYVISHPQEDMNNVRKYDPLDPIECLELHLKKVVLKNYDGNRTQVIHFAQFFVLNAKVLKEMEIGVVNRCNSKWMRFQRKRLQVENRASRDAQIELKWDTKKSFKYHECLAFLEIEAGWKDQWRLLQDVHGEGDVRESSGCHWQTGLRIVRRTSGVSYEVCTPCRQFWSPARMEIERKQDVASSEKQNL